uniref:Uncharacterized protein n=1 Tax=Arundo donax TaxID=35708 RepID=A0A0A9A7D2_ARUDO
MWIRGCCFLSLVWSVAAGAWRLPAKKSRKIVRNQNTEFKQYSIQFLQTDDTGSTKGSESLHTSDPEMHHSILELPS